MVVVLVGLVLLAPQEVVRSAVHDVGRVVLQVVPIVLVVEVSPEGHTYMTSK